MTASGTSDSGYLNVSVEPAVREVRTVWHARDCLSLPSHGCGIATRGETAMTFYPKALFGFLAFVGVLALAISERETLSARCFWSWLSSRP